MLEYLADFPLFETPRLLASATSVMTYGLMRDWTIHNYTCREGRLYAHKGERGDFKGVKVIAVANVPSVGNFSIILVLTSDRLIYRPTGEVITLAAAKFWFGSTVESLLPRFYDI